MSLSEEIARKAENGSLIVGVVGLGYVGLPLAVAFSKKLHVIGYDTVAEKVDMLRKGISYIDDVREVRNNNFFPTNDETKLHECDVIIICVPTPLHEDKRPDLGPVKGASSIVGKNLRRGQLIILESTTYPGTTEEIMIPILERESGLKAVDDFGIAYSPERIDPGNKIYTVETTPKVVGGGTPEWTEAASAVYGTAISNIVKVSDCKTAEMVKIFENVFRNVNIALVNELALICERMSISVWEVIDAAKTKPYGFMAFYPGPGVGGHCIPLDPYYLSYRARQFDYIPQFIETSGEINDYMPIHVVNLTRLGLSKVGKKIHGARVAVLGIAYKPDVSDTRESPAALVISELIDEGAEVKVFDPLAKEIATKSGRFAVEGSLGEIMAWAECAILVTPHTVLVNDLEAIMKTAGKEFVIVDTKRGLKRTKEMASVVVGLGNILP
ncbi:MAG: nucleotide sugar dehydrogenase [Methanomassiliicoccales archaeon]|nr:nucleotide sugar dehydrogenase [Methanomassiliicoccales archaeon]